MSINKLKAGFGFIKDILIYNKNKLVTFILLKPKIIIYNNLTVLN